MNVLICTLIGLNWPNYIRRGNYKRSTPGSGGEFMHSRRRRRVAKPRHPLQESIAQFRLQGREIVRVLTNTLVMLVVATGEAICVMRPRSLALCMYRALLSGLDGARVIRIINTLELRTLPISLIKAQVPRERIRPADGLHLSADNSKSCKFERASDYYRADAAMCNHYCRPQLALLSSICSHTACV